MKTLEKKMNTNHCEEHRTISLISHASKMTLKILYTRLMCKVKEYIGWDQFGFMKGRGTRDAIGVLRVICERTLSINKDVFICFIDYEKAFDRVNWVKLMSILKEIGVDYRDRKAIWELYMNQSAAVMVDGELTERATIGRGVRQGGLLSTILYNIYAEAMMKEALENNNDGIRVGGIDISADRYADDQAMISNTNAGLQRLLDLLNETGKRYGMKVNIKKTKVLRVSKKKRDSNSTKITIDGIKIKQVKIFCYLGSIISEDGRCENDINCRLGMAKSKFIENKQLLTGNTTLETKKSIILGFQTRH